MKTSVRRRFLFTLGANLLRSGLSFMTGLLVARWLLPEAYGRMAFLLGTFLGIRQFLDMGTSAAFFTFLSQRPRTRWFMRAFFGWLALQFLLPALIIAFVLPAGWIDRVWHGEHRGLVLLAFAAAFMQNSVWPAMQQAGESQRRTAWVQTVGLVTVVAHLLAVAAFWRFGVLGVPAILAAVAVEYGLATVVAYRRYEPAAAEEAAEGSWRDLVRKYAAYCRPLVPYAWLGFAAEFADRWLLQNYGGGVQQAYYAVGAQFASIALLATTSILNIFWKEIAEAHHRGDRERTAGLYLKVSRLLFFSGAAVAGVLIPWAQDLLTLLVGSAYSGGAATLGIMFLYPVHQALGQINGTMLYATERVSVQVAIGSASLLLGIVTTYFALAPATAPVPGLGLASQGLAVKMVLVQLVSVNAGSFVLSRMCAWRFDWPHQFVALGACLGAGWLAHALAIMWLAGGGGTLLTVGVSVALYAILIASFVYSLPSVIGSTRGELRAFAFHH